MSNVSKFARNGSHASVASTVGSSADSSSHDHFLNTIRSGPTLQTWLQESLGFHHRHERIAVNSMSAGIAHMTREMVGMHGIQQAPDIRGILDSLPTARPEDLGLRQQHRTWPMSHQHQMLRQKLGTFPLTKTEAFLAQQHPVQGK